MSEIDTLVGKYERQLALPWVPNLPPPQRVWFVIYDKGEERRIRPRMVAFEVATRNAGHGWKLLDLTDSFAKWMAAHEYRDAYFEQPELMEMELSEFGVHISQELEGALTAPEVDHQTVVAVLGVGSLFGLVRTSDVLPRVEPLIRGRLVVFWPGVHSGANYRLLDARDGWNYHAVPISAAAGE